MCAGWGKIGDMSFSFCRVTAVVFYDMYSTLSLLYSLWKRTGCSYRIIDWFFCQRLINQIL